MWNLKKSNSEKQRVGWWVTRTWGRGEVRNGEIVDAADANWQL